MKPEHSEKTWNAGLYDDKNAFVWKHGRGVIELLAPQPGERILDLGCGTGHLTSQIAGAGAEVVGIDKSTTMIEEARRLYPNLRFEIADATDFHFDEPFDAVFSNAAIHWMKDQAGVARCIWEALNPGGRFVAELGGKGNISAIRRALTEAVTAAGEVINAEPFARYYPTIGEYATLLEAQGFRVTFASHFDRPTKLDNGEQGLRNWLLTFTDNVIESLPPQKRETVIANVEQKLRPELFREGSWFADYRRLRIRAFRVPASVG
ncbi:MAG TPA: methyltransferase domain-containing protein [Blastocatellia bacterium]|nr:methyltransferase domain-containing protein [Blastocatellia bacterium]